MIYDIFFQNKDIKHEKKQKEKKTSKKLSK